MCFASGDNASGCIGIGIGCIGCIVIVDTDCTNAPPDFCCHSKQIMQCQVRCSLANTDQSLLVDQDLANRTCLSCCTCNFHASVLQQAGGAFDPVQL